MLAPYKSICWLPVTHVTYISWMLKRELNCFLCLSSFLFWLLQATVSGCSHTSDIFKQDVSFAFPGHFEYTSLYFIYIYFF